MRQLVYALIIDNSIYEDIPTKFNSKGRIKAAKQLFDDLHCDAVDMHENLTCSEIRAGINNFLLECAVHASEHIESSILIIIYFFGITIYSKNQQFLIGSDIEFTTDSKTLDNEDPFTIVKYGYNLNSFNTAKQTRDMYAKVVYMLDSNEKSYADTKNKFKGNEPKCLLHDRFVIFVKPTKDLFWATFFPDLDPYKYRAKGETLKGIFDTVLDTTQLTLDPKDFDYLFYKCSIDWPPKTKYFLYEDNKEGKTINVPIRLLKDGGHLTITYANNTESIEIRNNKDKYIAQLENILYEKNKQITMLLKRLAKN